MRYQKLTGTTNGTGDVTITGDSPISGLLFAVEWIDGDLDNNNTAVLSAINTASGVDRVLLTIGAGEGDADKMYYVRELEHDNACTALATHTYPVIDGYIKLVIASGGSAKTGGCVIHWFEM